MVLAAYYTTGVTALMFIMLAGVTGLYVGGAAERHWHRHGVPLNEAPISVRWRCPHCDALVVVRCTHLADAMACRAMLEHQHESTECHHFDHAWTDDNGGQWT